MNIKEIDLFSEAVYLTTSGAVFRPRNSTLYTADLHLSKDAHFRKEGIPIPLETTLHDLQILETHLTIFSAERCVFLGDFFHSSANEHIWEIISWGQQHRDVTFELISGNHDIPDSDWLQKFGFSRVSPLSEDLGWTLSHFPDVLLRSNKIGLAGHIHPAVRLKGKARQSLRLPCFWKKGNAFILPAFGSFKGSHLIKPEHGNQVFALSSEHIFELTL